MKWSFTSSLVFLFQLSLFTKCTVNYHYDTPPEHVVKADEGSRVTGIQDFEGKDIILCWLFAVHRSSAASGRCGTTLKLKGT